MAGPHNPNWWCHAYSVQYPDNCCKGGVHAQEFGTLDAVSPADRDGVRVLATVMPSDGPGGSSDVFGDSADAYHRVDNWPSDEVRRFTLGRTIRFEMAPRQYFEVDGGGDLWGGAPVTGGEAPENVGYACQIIVEGATYEIYDLWCVPSNWHEGGYHAIPVDWVGRGDSERMVFVHDNPTMVQANIAFYGRPWTKDCGQLGEPTSGKAPIWDQIGIEFDNVSFADNPNGDPAVIALKNRALSKLASLPHLDRVYQPGYQEDWRFDKYDKWASVCFEDDGGPDGLIATLTARKRYSGEIVQAEYRLRAAHVEMWMTLYQRQWDEPPTTARDMLPAIQVRITAECELQATDGSTEPLVALTDGGRAFRAPASAPGIYTLEWRGESGPSSDPVWRDLVQPGVSYPGPDYRNCCMAKALQGYEVGAKRASYTGGRELWLGSVSLDPGIDGVFGVSGLCPPEDFPCN